jgi:hypothetical protein
MTPQIERVIANGKPLAVIQKLVKAELLKQDKATWMSEKQGEYGLLFPVTREITQVEYEIYANNNGEELPEYIKEEYPPIAIDYSEDETYVTFNDWLNETKVITEAVEATYDEDGMELTPYVAEITELVRPHTSVDMTDDMVDTKINEYPEYAKYIKANKEANLNVIVVEVNSKLFDGNEKARLNILSALQASTFTGIATTQWRLADNTVAEVTVAELQEALTKAIQAVGTVVLL